MLSQSSGVAPRACTLFILPLLTLAFPLGVLLVVLQRLPAEEVQLASTDARLLQPVSTFWCASQEITSGHPFYAYKVPKVPAVLKEPPHLHSLAFRFNLLKGKYHLLRYHLLTGSTLELAGCTSQNPAPFEVFYGKEAWTDCLKVLTYVQKEKDSDSDESTSSESDSVEINHQGAGQDEEEKEYMDNNVFENRRHEYKQNFRRKSSQKLSCKNALLSGKLYLSQTKEDPSPSCPQGHNFPFALTAGRTGKYYVLVRTDGLTEPGGVLLHVRLNRTSYELPESVLFCRSPSACAIPLTFGAEERVVVFVSAEPDAGAALFPVKSKCQPRAAFYLVVFLLLPVLFALALLYVIRFQRRRRKRNATHRHIREASQRETGTQQSREEVPVLKEDDALENPPSYRDVAGQPRSASNSPPPPSYEELLRQPLVSVHRF